MFITNIIFILSILSLKADSNNYLYCVLNGNAEETMYIMTKKINSETKDTPLNFTDWIIFNNDTLSNTNQWENYTNQYNDTKENVHKNLRNLDDYVKSFFRNDNSSLHFNMLHLLILLLIFII